MMRILLYVGLVVLFVGCGGETQPHQVEVTPAVTEEPVTSVDVQAEVTPTKPLPLPVALADAQYECHGMFQGKPFWLRLEPKHPVFKTPIIQLQYTAPDKETVDGTILYNYPMISVSPQLMIWGWKEQTGRQVTSAYYDPQSKAYVVLCEREKQIGDEVLPELIEHTVEGPQSWDLHLAPFQLLLAWREGSSAAVPLIDLFGDQKRTELAWRDKSVTVADQRWVITADQQGRLQSITSAGEEILRVTAWLPDLSPADAQERKVKLGAK